MTFARPKKKRRSFVVKVIKGKTVLIESEALTQTKYFDWLSNERSSARPYCTAIPNGGSRHVVEAMNLKRQGVTAGFLDTVHFIPSGNYHGLLIEFKRIDKRKPSKEQAEKIELLRGVGYRCEICCTLSEARSVFDEYIGNTLKRIMEENTNVEGG